MEQYGLYTFQPKLLAASHALLDQSCPPEAVTRRNPPAETVQVLKLVKTGMGCKTLWNPVCPSVLNRIWLNRF